MEKIHLRSLESTLRENSGKARRTTKEFLFWVVVLACTLVLFTITYRHNSWLYLSIAIGLLLLTAYYYKVLHNYWQTNEKIKRKIRQLKQQ